MAKNRETRRRRLDFEPVIINKRVFLDLLSRELPDEYNVVLHEFHRIKGEDELHVGTNLNITMFLKDQAAKLIARATKESTISDLTQVEDWEKVNDWLEE